MPEQATQITQTDNIQKKFSNNPHVNPNLSQYDKAAVTLMRNNPDMSKADIGKQLVESGFSRNEKTIYSRLKKNDYLCRELQAIENHHQEALIRETYPIAEKVLNRALKSRDKTLDLKGKFPYVKLAYDKVHGETHKHTSSPTINIQAVEKMQVVIGNDLEGTASAQKAT